MSRGDEAVWLLLGGLGLFLVACTVLVILWAIAELKEWRRK